MVKAPKWNLPFKEIRDGTLLTLGGGINVGEFTNKTVQWGRAQNIVRNAMYYFVPEGAAAGAGRLSKGMAQAAVEYIRDGIKDPSLRDKRYKGPPIRSRSDAYQDWVNQIGLGRTPVMSLTGWSADYLTVVKETGKGLMVGFRPHDAIRTPVVGKIPMQLSDKEVNIAAYMRTHELGLNKMPKRPLLTGLMLGYIQQFDDTWASLFEQYLKDVYWDAVFEKPKEEVSLSSFGTQGERGPLEHAPNISNVYQEQVDILDESAGMLLDAADSFMQAASDKFAGGEGQNARSKTLFIEVAKQQLSKLDLTEGQKAAVIRACLRGKFEGLYHKYD